MPVIILHELPKEEITSILSSMNKILAGKSLQFPINVAIVYNCCEPEVRLFQEAVKRLGGRALALTAEEAHALSSYDLIITFLPEGTALKIPEHKPVIQFSSQEESPITAFADVYALLKSKKGLRRLLVAGELPSNTANSFVVIAAKLGIKLAIVSGKQNSQGIQTRYMEKAREYSIVSKYEEASEAGDVDAVYLIAPKGNYKSVFPNAFYSYSYSSNSSEVLAAAMSVILYSLHKQVT